MSEDDGWKTRSAAHLSPPTWVLPWVPWEAGTAGEHGRQRKRRPLPPALLLFPAVSEAGAGDDQPESPQLGAGLSSCLCWAGGWLQRPKRGHPCGHGVLRWASGGLSVAAHLQPEAGLCSAGGRPTNRCLPSSQGAWLWDPSEALRGSAEAQALEVGVRQAWTMAAQEGCCLHPAG